MSHHNSENRNYQELLENDEKIKMIINPKKGLMLHANDGFKIIVFLFFMSIVLSVGFEHPLFPLFGIALLATSINAMLKRYKNTLFTYIVTDKRVLFLRKGVIIKSKNMEKLDRVTYENSGKNRGYIILGEPEELFPTRGRRGISFGEDHYVLDNLENFNEVAALIKSMQK